MRLSRKRCETYASIFLRNYVEQPAVPRSEELLCARIPKLSFRKPYKTYKRSAQSYFHQERRLGTKMLQEGLKMSFKSLNIMNSIQVNLLVVYTN
ncbi:hypothetical protein AnigIFM63604_006566 [Aspergillus niger]|uniref:Uncharacterized protein n=1 Tax=Aspergillus niger TaxID=5061 RepID=A0A9W6A9M9_ASPNG|nr:hypothetical protein AnigIFM63604_006566 [Aspergillus niger]